MMKSSACWAELVTRFVMKWAAGGVESGLRIVVKVTVAEWRVTCLLLRRR